MVYIIGEAPQLETKQVGGKSGNLNDLKSKGLPVPPGIIVDDSYFKEGSKEDLSVYLNPEKKYAVRSSALDEDGANFSFAGLQDTYLNVAFQDVTAKVEACYQSQFNDRATAYRKTFGIDGSKGMSVVVQEMVAADFAGVLFTQNPLNNRIDQVVIEVVTGLGEALVSGHTTPTTYTVMKQDQEIVEVKEHGASVSESSINDLIRYGTTIEAIYRVPQDIEFAIKDGVVHILQARPITTTTKVPKQVNEGLRFYLSFAHVQNMMYPFTPVGADLLQSFFSYSDHPLLKGRLVYNGEFLFVDLTDVLLTPEFLYSKVMNTVKNINFDLPELADEYRLMNKKRKMLPMSFILMGMKMAKRTLGIMKDKNPSSDNVILWLENHYTAYEHYNEKELMALKSEALFSIFAKIAPYLATGMISFSRVEKLLNKWQVDKSDFVKIVAGVKGNITAEMGLLYDDMLLHYGTDQGEALLATYIERFGMRVDGEIDMGRPRPVEDLPGFREQVRKMAEGHGGISLREKHHQRILEGDQVMVRLKGTLRARQFKKLDHWVQLMKAYYILREHPKHTITKIFQLYRQYVSNPFETMEEHYQGGADAETLNNRKNIYQGAYGKKIPVAMLSNGLILKPKKKNQGGSIVGFGVSSGVVTAKVRVIENIHDDVIKDGEILVTRFTDPGWTPMLAKSGGIITEVGGMMTHGAIVAREYGIPAIVGVEDAVKLFTTGDEITIDGDSGVIV